MKFKFLKLDWDFTPIVGMLWVLYGCSLIGYTFTLDISPWQVDIFWFITLVIFVATAESVEKRLSKFGA
jgi:hypothetical protein